MTNTARVKKIQSLDTKIQSAKWNALIWLRHARDLMNEQMRLSEDGCLRLAIQRRLDANHKFIMEHEGVLALLQDAVETDGPEFGE